MNNFQKQIKKCIECLRWLVVLIWHYHTPHLINSHSILFLCATLIKQINMILKLSHAQSKQCMWICSFILLANKKMIEKNMKPLSWSIALGKLLQILFPLSANKGEHTCVAWPNELLRFTINSQCKTFFFQTNLIVLPLLFLWFHCLFCYAIDVMTWFSV